MIVRIRLTAFSFLISFRGKGKLFKQLQLPLTVSGSRKYEKLIKVKSVEERRTMDTSLIGGL